MKSIKFKTGSLIVPTDDQYANRIDEVDMLKIDFRGENVGVRRDFLSRKLVNNILLALGQQTLESLGI